MASSFLQPSTYFHPGCFSRPQHTKFRIKSEAFDSFLKVLDHCNFYLQEFEGNLEYRKFGIIVDREEQTVLVPDSSLGSFINNLFLVEYE